MSPRLYEFTGLDTVTVMSSQPPDREHTGKDVRLVSMKRIRRITGPAVTISGALIALSVGAAACGSSGTPAVTTPTPTVSTTTSGTTQMLPPVIVGPEQTQATVSVGKFIVFNVDAPANTKVSTDNPEFLELTQGHDDGSALFNPGGKGIAVGTATVTITGPDGETTRFVTVEVVP